MILLFNVDGLNPELTSPLDSESHIKDVLALLGICGQVNAGASCASRDMLLEIAFDSTARLTGQWFHFLDSYITSCSGLFVLVPSLCHQVDTVIHGPLRHRGMFDYDLHSRSSPATI